jgi:hypothetical protein
MKVDPTSRPVCAKVHRWYDQKKQKSLVFRVMTFYTSTSIFGGGFSLYHEYILFLSVPVAARSTA